MKNKTTTTNNALYVKAKVKRKGVHSKSKASRSKNAKNYLKKNVGQG